MTRPPTGKLRGVAWREGWEEGWREGKGEALLIFLQEWFGHVSLEFRVRIQEAEESEIDDWLERFFDAEELERIVTGGQYSKRAVRAASRAKKARRKDASPTRQSRGTRERRDPRVQ